MILFIIRSTTCKHIIYCSQNLRSLIISNFPQMGFPSTFSMTSSMTIHFPRSQHLGTPMGNFVELARHDDEGRCLSRMNQLQWKMKIPRLIISKKLCVRAQVLKLDFIISTSFNSSSLRSHFNVVPDFLQPILLLFTQSDLPCHYLRCVVTEAFGTLPLSLSWKRFFNSLFSSHLCIRRCSFDIQNAVTVALAIFAWCSL